MILRLVTADGSQSPASAESVEVHEDGTITGWRTVSAGGVGWFAGSLPPKELTELRTLIAEAGPEPPPSTPARPGAAEEVLELPGTGPVSIAAFTAVTGSADADPGSGPDSGTGPGPGPAAGGWPALAVAARHLLDRLTDFPRAAVAVTAPGRLIHRGTDPLRLDLTTVAVRTTAWRGYYEPAGDWSTLVSGPGEVEAGPGWSYDLPIEPGPDDAVIHLAADFAILSGTTRVPVRARYTPALQQG